MSNKTNFEFDILNSKYNFFSRGFWELTNLITKFFSNKAICSRLKIIFTRLHGLKSQNYKKSI